MRITGSGRSPEDMEYETYETDATYDEMYDEGTKEKVCLICTESASFYLNQ